MNCKEGCSDHPLPSPAAASEVNDLDDISAGAPAEGDVLVYREGTAQWESAPQARPVVRASRLWVDALNSYVSSNTSGSGGFNITGVGLVMTTGATAGSHIRINVEFPGTSQTWWHRSGATPEKFLDCMYSCWFRWYPDPSTYTEADLFIGVANTPMAASGAGLAFTDSHFGMTLEARGGTVTNYVSSATDAVQEKTDIGSVLDKDYAHCLTVIRTGFSQLEYWLNGEQVAIHTVRVPDEGETQLLVEASNKNTANDVGIVCGAQSYDLYQNPDRS